MNNKLSKKIIASLVIAASVTMMCACSGSRSNSDAKYKPLSSKDDSMYNISVITGDDDAYSTGIRKGFRDAMDDLIGSGHYTLSTVNGTTGVSTAKQAIDTELSKEDKPDLLLTVGNNVLTAASESTDSIPVIGTDVLDFQTLLHLNGSKWSSPTGSNITGVSTRAPMADVMSLIVESCPQLSSVGLLYSPEDSDAIYQNEILESYMDEAGIPWREYELQSTDAAIAAHKVKNPESDSSIVKKTSPSVHDSMEGPYPDPEPVSPGGLSTVLNAPASARSAKASANWKGGRMAEEYSKQHIIEQVGVDDPDPTGSAIPANTSSTIEGNAQVLSTAAAECSVLFISAGSDLSDQMESIRNTAMNAKTATVSCDGSLGIKTLTCLYTDPYAMGYAAGKQAYRILIGHEDPGKMNIECAPSSSIVKLYQDDIADQLGMTFPKSFHEVDDYLENNPPGTTTERVKNNSTDKK